MKKLILLTAIAFTSIAWGEEINQLSITNTTNHFIYADIKVGTKISSLGAINSQQRVDFSLPQESEKYWVRVCWGDPESQLYCSPCAIVSPTKVIVTGHFQPNNLRNLKIQCYRN